MTITESGGLSGHIGVVTESYNDSNTPGLGSFAKKKYLEYAESVAESAMEKAFPHLKDIDNPLPPNNNRYPVYNYGLPKDDKKILSPIDAFL